MPTKTDSDKTVKPFDVVQPGKTPANATSRPVIVGHPSMMKHDPMVVGESDDLPEEKQEIKVTRELKIVPLTEDPEALAQQSVTEDMPPAEDVIEEVPEDASGDDSDADDSEKPASNDASESSETGVVNTLMNEVNSKQADKKQKEDLESRTKELEKTIETKEFFVPIGHSHHTSSNNMLFVIILVLITGLAALNFAVDAGLLDIGVDALTNLL